MTFGLWARMGPRNRVRWESRGAEGRCHGYDWLFGFPWAITLVVIANDHFWFWGWVFRVKLSDEDIAEIECLRIVAMATNVGTKIAITGFVWLIVTRQLLMQRGLSGWPTDCRYFRYLAPKGRCDGNHFWCSVGYNFGCVIASGTIFDSRDGFSGSSCLMNS